MVWPILISASVIPGAASVRPGEAPHAKDPRLAALDCRKARRDTMAGSVLFLLEKEARRRPPPRRPHTVRHYPKVRRNNVTPVTPKVAGRNWGLFQRPG